MVQGLSLSRNITIAVPFPISPPLNEEIHERPIAGRLPLHTSWVDSDIGGYLRVKAQVIIRVYARVERDKVKTRAYGTRGFDLREMISIAL